MNIKTPVKECRNCDFVSDEPFAICPLCSFEYAGCGQCGKPLGNACVAAFATVEDADNTDFQTGFRFAMRLMERVGHRIDTKELFDTLSDVALGVVRIPGTDAQSQALRMLQVIEDERIARETIRRPKAFPALKIEKVPSYS